ncbi:MAG: hypothetical protein ACI8UO_005644 [Verrucomicrobiales bacterium]|jgi:hypothetical protein
METTFDSTIERLEDGIRFHCVPIPEPLGSEIWESGDRRFLASLGDTAPLRRAIQGSDCSTAVAAVNIAAARSDPS